jgi:hypothetical protein
MDLLFASPDLLLIAGILCTFMVLGFMYGAQKVSEVALALMLGGFLLSLIPLSYFPKIAEDLLSPLGVTLELLAFTTFSGISWWVVHDTASATLDFSPAMSKVLMAAVGASGIVIFVITRIVSISQWYTFGDVILAIAGTQERILIVLLVSLVLVSLSRKM